MDMRRRSLIAAGAASAAAVLGGAATANAATLTASKPARPADFVNPNAPLRDLAAAIGLRFGSAIIPQDINTPSFNAIASTQLDVYTPGNEMKWQVVEPTQGNFDWSGADNLMAFAASNDALV